MCHINRHTTCHRSHGMYIEIVSIQDTLEILHEHVKRAHEILSVKQGGLVDYTMHIECRISINNGESLGEWGRVFSEIEWLL